MDALLQQAHLVALTWLLARPGAQAEMMQADPVGNEALLAVLLGAALDADRGAAADVIEEVVAVIDFLQAEEGQQLAIEGARLFPLADGEDDVRHPVDFDHGCFLGFER